MKRGPDDPDLDVRVPTPWERLRRWLGPPRSYRLTRSLLLRLLGVVYLAAFVGLTRQVLPLLGSHGLTPSVEYLDLARAAGEDVWSLPTLFWLDCSDTTLVFFAWSGVVLSLIVVAGFANAPVMFVLWLVYGSFARVGNFWWGFGWEIQLLETGFLAVFLAPPLDPRPWRSRPPPLVVIVLYRWLTFRIMLGAGLIKWRGDPCWHDLTCLDYHFETQPIPNPLSGVFHRMPDWVHAGGVVFNHVVELIAPWFVFGPRRARIVAGALMIGFQLVLIVSGNLAFLNWLTIVPVIACFDDDVLRRLVPRRLRRDPPAVELHRAQRYAAWALAGMVAILSLWVVDNLTSSRQKMNYSFDRFDLVNTYGAFGSVGDVRHELVIEGTADPDPDTATWREYELPCKPGALRRRPCLLGPYHYRLDWLIWFAAMAENWEGAPWVVNVVYHLLHREPRVLSLIAHNPFPDRPPRWIRIRRFVYRFAGSGSSDWWVREDPTEWLPPVSLDTPGLEELIEANGWRSL